MSSQIANYGSSKNPYVLQQIRGASSEKLILMLYDIGLKSCRTKDRIKAAKVLVELISALNFDYKEIALEYFDLYRYALDCVHRGEFEETIMVFEGLREVWKSAVIGNKATQHN